MLTLFVVQIGAMELDLKKEFTHEPVVCCDNIETCPRREERIALEQMIRANTYDSEEESSDLNEESAFQELELKMVPNDVIVRETMPNTVRSPCRNCNMCDKCQKKGLKLIERRWDKSIRHQIFSPKVALLESLLAGTLDVTSPIIYYKDFRPPYESYALDSNEFQVLLYLIRQRAKKPVHHQKVQTLINRAVQKQEEGHSMDPHTMICNRRHEKSLFELQIARFDVMVHGFDVPETAPSELRALLVKTRKKLRRSLRKDQPARLAFALQEAKPGQYYVPLQAYVEGSLA